MTAVKALAWDDLAEGAEARLTFTIGEAEMRAFAALSGDANPLHSDAAFARARGFAGAVVYGGLIIAQVSKLIGTELPGRDAVWTGIRLDFRKPLYVGEAAELTGRVVHRSRATRSLTIALEVVAGGRTVATGEAEARLMDKGTP